MVEGGSEKAFASWLAARPQAFRDRVKVVAMDAFAGYRKAAAREVPGAVEVLDPFHIVKLAGDKLTKVRCRLRREATGRRGRRDDPLYKCRRVLLKTGTPCTNRQKEGIAALFSDPANKPLELANGTYRKIIACYAHKDREKGRGMMAELIESLAAGGRGARLPRTRDPGPHPEETHGRRPRVLRLGAQRERAHRSHQRKARDPQGHSPGIPQPRQLHHQKPAARRQLQTHHPNPPLTHAPTHQNRKSPYIYVYIL